MKVIHFNQEENEIIRLAIENNRSAQQKIYAKFSSKMLSVCRQYIKDLHQAEDIMITAFMKVFANLKNFEKKGSFEGWIRRIMVNECISHIRGEFDFTKPKIKNDKTYFKSHDSFRLGISGYFGANVKSKQILKYDSDVYHTEEKTKGDFNTNGFVYGLSTYLGYKATSLYLKYDLNPLFENNTIDQNNISLGVRFDFN